MRNLTPKLLLIFVLAACVLPSVTYAQSAPAGDFSVTPDVVYGHKDGMALTFDVLRPDNANGAAVLYMVSGGWVSRWSDPERLAARTFPGLLEEGFTVIPVRHGSAPLYKVPEAEADVRRALRYVQMHANELGIDVDRIGVFGGSAGGHLSLMLGLAAADEGRHNDDEPLRAPNPVAAIVAYYPPVDLRPIAGPNERFPALDFPGDQAAAISPILFVSPDDPPTLLIHGDADGLVPLSQSELILAELQSDNIESELIVIPGGDHGFTRRPDRMQAQQAMTAWFVRQLASPRSSTTAQASELVGSWRLDSWNTGNGPRCSAEDGAVNGQIIYSADGHMSAQLGCGEIDISDNSGLDTRAVTRRLGRRHLSYYGGFTLDRRAGTVTHHVMGASNVGMVDTDQVRTFVFDGNDKLTLSPGGEQLLVWLRNR